MYKSMVFKNRFFCHPMIEFENMRIYHAIKKRQILQQSCFFASPEKKAESQQLCKTHIENTQPYRAYEDNKKDKKTLSESEIIARNRQIFKFGFMPSQNGEMPDDDKYFFCKYEHKNQRSYSEKDISLLIENSKNPDDVKRYIEILRKIAEAKKSYTDNTYIPLLSFFEKAKYKKGELIAEIENFCNAYKKSFCFGYTFRNISDFVRIPINSYIAYKVYGDNVEIRQETNDDVYKQECERIIRVCRIITKKLIDAKIIQKQKMKKYYFAGLRGERYISILYGLSLKTAKKNATEEEKEKTELINSEKWANFPKWEKGELKISDGYTTGYIKYYIYVKGKKNTLLVENPYNYMTFADIYPKIAKKVITALGMKIEKETEKEVYVSRYHPDTGITDNMQFNRITLCAYIETMIKEGKISREIIISKTKLKGIEHENQCSTKLDKRVIIDYGYKVIANKPKKPRKSRQKKAKLLTPSNNLSISNILFMLQNAPAEKPTVTTETKTETQIIQVDNSTRYTEENFIGTMSI